MCFLRAVCPPTLVVCLYVGCDEMSEAVRKHAGRQNEREKRASPLNRRLYRHPCHVSCAMCH